MRLAGAVSRGSGAVNEDGWGMAGSAEDVAAAWIFDGVTGINGRAHLPAASDASWLVARAQARLAELAGADSPLQDIVGALVDGLIADWIAVSAGLAFPEDYDPPAACLVLVKRQARGWQAAQLGDSCLLAHYADGAHCILAASPNNVFDNWLAEETARRHVQGATDVATLLAEFRPQLLAGRARRNRRGGYGILEAAAAAKNHVEYLELGEPAEILLCTDGYYRAVDHYGMYTDESLIEASGRDGGVERVLGEIRELEAGDPACKTFRRFKPADDATAVMLRR